MSRRVNFTKAVASGYGFIVANAVYTLVSVPLALAYLNKAEFGLWALVTQLAGYLALIDFGMAASISRFLVEHKDAKHDAAYGTVVKTGVLVTAMQGLLVALLGFALAPLLATAIDIPAELRAAFIDLLIWQCLFLGISMGTKILSHLLNAHQRYDYTNYASILALGAGFATQWLTFHAGYGLFSMVWAAAASTTTVLLVTAVGCIRAAVLPQAGAWGSVSYSVFRELFVFGGELFLQVVGWQLLAASQVVIISRFLGLEAAAVYSVGTKVFSLVQQAVWRVFDYSIGALSEMAARGEEARLRDRFRDIWVMSGSLAVATGTIAAMCNQSFMALWTHGEVAWNPLNDGLLALSMVAFTLNRVHGGLAWVLKTVRRMRYVYLAEGVAFVAVGTLVARPFGLPGILLASILCDFVITGTYGLAISSSLLKLPGWGVALQWLRPTALLTLAVIPAALAVWLAARNLPPVAQFSVNALVGVPMILGLLWKVGLPQNLRAEVMSLLTRRKASNAG